MIFSYRWPYFKQYKLEKESQYLNFNLNLFLQLQTLYDSN